MPEPLPGVGRLLADSGMTGGAYELIEFATDDGGGPPAHVHRERSEAFYVLEGDFSFWIGEDLRGAGPGDFVLVPPGTVHRFEARSTPCRLLGIIAPAGLEDFFREMARLLGEGLSEHDVRTRLAERYDSHPVPKPRSPT